MSGMLGDALLSKVPKELKQNSLKSYWTLKLAQLYRIIKQDLKLQMIGIQFLILAFKKDFKLGLLY